MVENTILTSSVAQERPEGKVGLTFVQNENTNFVTIFFTDENEDLTGIITISKKELFEMCKPFILK